MTCPDDLRLAALFDGELDADEAAALEAHIVRCDACQHEFSSWQALRSGLRAEAPRRAPSYLHGRIAAALEAERRPAWYLRLPGWTFWSGALSGALAAAVIAVFMVQASNVETLTDMVAATHLRALQPGHATDFAASEPARIESWAKANAAVTAGSLPANAEFRLAGARRDVLYDSQALALVYRAKDRLIDLIVWRDDGRRLPQAAREGSLNIRFWRSKGLIYCAVARLSAAELERFAKFFREGRE